MKTKSFFIGSIVAISLLGGINAYSSPASRLAADKKETIKILSARIENAIVDLGEIRTRDDIKNAALIVLEQQNSNAEINAAALNMVIQNAILLEDGMVVGALKAVEFETLDIREQAEVRTDPEETIVKDEAVIVQSRFALPPPPAANSSGGSDY